MKINGDCLCRDKNDNLVVEGPGLKKLLKVYQQHGEFFMESLTQDPLWKKQGNSEENNKISAPKEPIYLSVNDLPDPYILKLNDVVRFGRATFRVIEMKNSKVEIPK